jgi:hypothetical protein
MSAPLILACLWALAAPVTAFLPMRFQIVPGLALLAAAPVLLVWIGIVHGAVFGLLGLAGFLSMFRRPLFYIVRRLMRRGGATGGNGAS